MELFKELGWEMITTNVKLYGVKRESRLMAPEGRTIAIMHLKGIEEEVFNFIFYHS